MKYAAYKVCLTCRPRADPCLHAHPCVARSQLWVTKNPLDLTLEKNQQTKLMNLEKPTAPSPRCKESCWSGSLRRTVPLCPTGAAAPPPGAAVHGETAASARACTAFRVWRGCGLTVLLDVMALASHAWVMTFWYRLPHAVPWPACQVHDLSVQHELHVQHQAHNGRHHHCHLLRYTRSRQKRRQWLQHRQARTKHKSEHSSRAAGPGAEGCPHLCHWRW